MTMPAGMPERRSYRLAAALVAACAVAWPGDAAHAVYPERPVTFIVPFGPGGANDVVARIIQPPLSEALGQTVVIENRAGAGGSIGTGYVARAKPDGYTFLLAASGFVVNPSLYGKVPYDPYKDFEPVAEITKFPILYTVRADSGIKTLKELIARARKEDGKLNYSSPGAGTLAHLGFELLKLQTGIKVVHVPYASAAPAAQALLGGVVEIGALSVAVGKPLIDAGKLTGLAVTGTERWVDLPNIPTITEAGFPKAVVETWQGIMVPAGTPKDVIAKLSKAFLTVMKNPDVRAKLLKAGFHSSGTGPEPFRKRVLDELPQWKELISKAGISVQPKGGKGK
jgi:tripartite-type tricarboxylate transporter receptor subunit TctC